MVSDGPFLFQARKIKRCFNEKDDCIGNEIVENEFIKDAAAAGSGAHPDRNGTWNPLRDDRNGSSSFEESSASSSVKRRLLINPDYAQSTDLSDGRDMFSPEDQLIEDAATS